MEDAKLIALIEQKKAAGPKGRKGGLGLGGAAMQLRGGNDSDEEDQEVLPKNALYSRFVRPGWKGHARTGRTGADDKPTDVAGIPEIACGLG